MDIEAGLLEIIILFAAAIFIVFSFSRMKISPIMGYFVAGAIIGSHGFGWVKASHTMDMLAELGIVFLLFLIGLELTLDRLFSMRAQVFGFGSLQVVITAAIIITLCMYYGLQVDSSVIIGCALALSSTAIVLQVLQENGMQHNQVGRLSIAVLIMQDFAVIPLLVLVPLLESNALESLLIPISNALIKAVIVLFIILIAGRLVLRPFFKLIASTKSNELFVATTLLIVLGSAYITDKLGLSMAMGAFVAGLLLAETEYRHEVEQVVLPFKSLLLGLFFMTVGMSMDFNYFISDWPKILLISFCLIAIKASIILFLCRAVGFRWSSSIHAGLLLAQCSEFALILFGLKASRSIIDDEVQSLLNSVVTFTMAFTPLFSVICIKILKKFSVIEESRKQIHLDVLDIDQHVIIAGYGRVGKMVSKMLSTQKVNYIIMDVDLSLVEKNQGEGVPIYQGDISKSAILESIAVDRAQIIVLCINNEVTLKKTIKVLNADYPNATIVVRIPDYSHVEEYKSLGAHCLIPETYETGLQIGSVVLSAVGFSDYAITSLKQRFRSADYSIPQSIDGDDY